MLDDHQGDIDQHQGEGYEVNYSEHPYYDILMGDRRHQKCNQKGGFFLHLSSPQGVVDVSDEEIVDGEVPFAPVLTQIPCVPPVWIESTVSEASQLTPQIQVRMEERVEENQPDIGGRDTHGED